MSPGGAGPNRSDASMTLRRASPAMAGWSAKLAALVLALGAVALLLVLLQWFTDHDGWTLGLALAFLLLVALPAAIGTLALLVGHHLRGQRAAPRTWAMLGIGLAFLMVGMAYVGGALPREVRSVPVEVMVFAEAVDARGTVTLARPGGGTLAGASFDLAANQTAARLVFMPLPPGAYALRVETDDGRSAVATIQASPRALPPRVILAPWGVDIRQDHGD